VPIIGRAFSSLSYPTPSIYWLYFSLFTLHFSLFTLSISLLTTSKPTVR